MTDHPQRRQPPEPDGPQASDLEPEGPEQRGVPDEEPDPMQLEAARLLANDARPTLREQGFDDEQILAWATTFTAWFGSGDADQFLAWIDEQQRR